MNKCIKTGLPALVGIWLYAMSLQGQPNAELPSDQLWKEIESRSSLPSEHTNPFESDLRAGRPIGEAPIGGMSAPVPDISLLSLIAFTIAAGVVHRKKRRE